MTDYVRVRIITDMNRLRATREAVGMSREALAADVPCSYDYIRRLEGPKPPNPTLGKARAICRVLGKSIDAVFPAARG